MSHSVSSAAVTRLSEDRGDDLASLSGPELDEAVAEHRDSLLHELERLNAGGPAVLESSSTHLAEITEELANLEAYGLEFVQFRGDLADIEERPEEMVSIEEVRSFRKYDITSYSEGQRKRFTKLLFDRAIDGQRFPGIQVEAVKQFADLQIPEALEILLNCATDDFRQEVREAAVHSISTYDTDEAKALVFNTALGHDSSLDQAWGIEALGNIDDPQAEELLITEFIRGPSVEIRKAAAIGLGGFDTSQSTAALASCLSDKEASEVVKRLALASLGKHSSDRAKQLLIRTSQLPGNDSQRLRVRAIESLGGHPDNESGRCLRGVLVLSKDREEQEAAASSLRRVVAGGASADELLDFPVLKEPPKRDQSMFSNPTAKIELIAALVDAGTPECRKRLRSWVKGGHVHFSQLEDVLRVFQDGPSASELRAVRSIVRSVFDTNARLALIKFLRQDDDPATSKILVNMISGASETVGKAAFLAVWGQHNKFARDAGARLASTYPEFLPE